MDVFVESAVLAHLVFDERYARMVLPFIKPEYFRDQADRSTFELIAAHYDRYNAAPTREALLIDLQKVDNLREDVYRTAKTRIETMSAEKTEFTWLVDTTEKFCKDAAVANALSEAVDILDRKNGKMVDAIPDLLSEALAVTFDKHVGHDYVQEAEQRFDAYRRKEEKIPFDVEKLNQITKGGVSRKTLTTILGGTGAGKTLVMCHQAAANLIDGRNVLYITNEMSEQKIAERIDANLLDVTLDELHLLSRDAYLGRMKRVRDKTVGRLIIKEYPTATAHVGHFRALLKELKLKRNFVPDVIYVDYINICTSSRVRAGNNVNSYTLIKAIAEELRGLAVEQNAAVVTATQTTRSGSTNSDPDLTDTSESFGLPMTCDLMYAIVVTEALEKAGLYMFKQLKNRFNETLTDRRFVVGVDKSKMRLFNASEADQQTIQREPDAPRAEAPQTLDRTGFGQASRDTRDRLKSMLK